MRLDISLLLSRKEDTSGDIKISSVFACVDLYWNEKSSFHNLLRAGTCKIRSTYHSVDPDAYVRLYIQIDGITSSGVRTYVVLCVLSLEMHVRLLPVKQPSTEANAQVHVRVSAKYSCREGT